MGYYTDYELTVHYFGINNDEKKLTPVSDLTLEQLNKEIDKMDIFEDSYKDEWYLCGAKWYDHDSDMLALSELFPEILFTLNGHGENPEDMWYTYYLNGKMQHCPAIIKYENFDYNKLETTYDCFNNGVFANKK